MQICNFNKKNNNILTFSPDEIFNLAWENVEEGEQIRY